MTSRTLSGLANRARHINTSNEDLRKTATPICSLRLRVFAPIRLLASMCFSFVTYKEWACGWRENTDRQKAWLCSALFTTRADRNSDRSIVSARVAGSAGRTRTSRTTAITTASARECWRPRWPRLQHSPSTSRSQTEEHHLIMSRLRSVCSVCEEKGRGVGEHPGIENTGGIQFRHVVSG